MQKKDINFKETQKKNRKKPKNQHICSETMCFIEENCRNPMEKLFTVRRVMGVLKYRVRIEREIETENSVANTITYILLQKILQILII